MARVELGIRLAADRLVSKVKEDAVQIAGTPTSDLFEQHSPSNLAKLEVHHRGNSRIVHYISEEGKSLGREVFSSETDVRQNFSKLRFEPLR